MRAAAARRRSPPHVALTLALLISLLLHGLLLSLTFGGSGAGLPGFSLPWQQRRAEVPELRIVLVPAPVPAVTPARAPPRSAAPTDGQAAAPTVEPGWPDPAPANPPPGSGPAALALAPEGTATWVVRAAPEMPMAATEAARGASSPEAAALSPPPTPAAAPLPADPPPPEPAREPVAPSGPVAEAQPELAQPSAAPREIPSEAQERADVARLDAERQQATRLAAAREEEARQAAARAEVARLETERIEAVRQAAVRQEAARQAAARVEEARLEAERHEAARQAALREEEAARLKAALADAERLSAERQEAARQEAARQEAARQEAARQEATRQAAANAEAARLQAAREVEARREATLRAIGRQLDDEAARRDAESAAARTSPPLAPSASSVRRGRLFGRTDPNAELILYAEAWARKIQLNMAFELVRDAARQAHDASVVTVAIRSDGSVESVTFVRSSGVAAIDDAIRRIVHREAPYPSFGPALAREFDVVEIRRTWTFDTAIRLN